MSPTRHVPGRGDLIWIDFDPQAGREQAGHRPALVRSPQAYNRVTGLVVVCPVTSRPKGYPYEVVLPAGLAVTGVVLADHVRSADWHAREARFADFAPASVVDEVTQKLTTLLS